MCRFVKQPSLTRNECTHHLVSASSSSSLPKTCCRACLPRCASLRPCRHRAVCRFGHSNLRDLRVLKEGWVSASRLLCALWPVAIVVSCSVAGYSVWLAAL